jgi:hypothetical protein
MTEGLIIVVIVIIVATVLLSYVGPNAPESYHKTKKLESKDKKSGENESEDEKEDFIGRGWYGYPGWYTGWRYPRCIQNVFGQTTCYPRRRRRYIY